MTRRVPVLSLLVALLAALVALTALAYATPPDPTWVDGYFVDGYFDDDDNDDGVFLITSSLATVDTVLLRSWRSSFHTVLLHR